jgi:hypothetical protein
MREMTLTLTVQNKEKLTDGFHASVTVDKGNLDIGRSIHVDLTLPDPTHFIAAIHCEVRYRDGSYWLNDVSPHTTVVNGEARHLHGPYHLRHGDHLVIGDYVIAVIIEGEGHSHSWITPSPGPMTFTAAEDSRGGSPYSGSRFGGDGNVAELVDAPTRQVHQNAMLSAVKELFETGSALAMDQGRNAYLESAYLGDIATMEAMLECNVSIDTVDKVTGMTALHLAVGRNHLEAARFLGSQGASFLPDKRGRMPTTIAAECEVSEELCDFIVEAEAAAEARADVFKRFPPAPPKT